MILRRRESIAYFERPPPGSAPARPLCFMPRPDSALTPARLLRLRVRDTFIPVVREYFLYCNI